MRDCCGVTRGTALEAGYSGPSPARQVSHSASCDLGGVTPAVPAGFFACSHRQQAALARSWCSSVPQAPPSSQRCHCPVVQGTAPQAVSSRTLWAPGDRTLEQGVGWEPPEDPCAGDALWGRADPLGHTEAWGRSISHSFPGAASPPPQEPGGSEPRSRPRGFLAVGPWEEHAASRSCGCSVTTRGFQIDPGGVAGKMKEFAKPPGWVPGGTA